MDTCARPRSVWSSGRREGEERADATARERRSEGSEVRRDYVGERGEGGETGVEREGEGEEKRRRGKTETETETEKEERMKGRAREAYGM